jgi:UDP-3-O-[3-hydroxymyristoyl] N-acetylglucosamine deacetylase
VSAAVDGIGLFSGAAVSVYLHRVQGATTFRLGRTLVPADVSSVLATPRCVVLGLDGARVAQVEHLLAALRVQGFWSGVLIEVDGPELPILDGSATPWLEPIAALGAPPPPPDPITLTAPVRLAVGPTTVAAEPGDALVDVTIDFDHPAIGAQRWTGGPDRYGELLAARTFALEHEVRALDEAGHLRGAAPGRGILFGVQGPNDALRSPDEPVRHKALDLVADLALLGRPLTARLRVDRGSHDAHVTFMRHLRSHPHLITGRPSPQAASDT